MPAVAKPSAMVKGTATEASTLTQNRRERSNRRMTTTSPHQWMMGRKTTTLKKKKTALAVYQRMILVH